MKPGKLRETLSASLLIIPVLAALASIVLSVTTRWLDGFAARSSWGGALFPGGADSMRSALSTIAASIVTFLGVVFSITMVVLQLASNRFSPRVLRTFLKDRTSKVTLAVFVATFTFTMAVLRAVPQPGSRALPAVSAIVAFALVLASVISFVAYLNHMARAVRISRIAAAIGDETADVIRWHHGTEDKRGQAADDAPAPPLPSEPSRTIPAPIGANLEAIDERRLAHIAAEADVVLVVKPMLGQFVPAGGPLIDVYGDGQVDDRRLLQQVDLGEERTTAQDPAFGFRQLVDIAERSLSPGTVDPTSAVQALDQLHDLLRKLAGLDLPPVRVTKDGDGKPRVLIPSRTWEQYLDLAVDEIVLYGRGSLQVATRLREMLMDLETVTSGDRKDAVTTKMEALPAPPDPYDRIPEGADARSMG
ncbi:MAG TPA: DUF2254 domain-containing protein [Actinomycetota bacterium]|nr:DUF2254 domain-containing protein [Actinomycetota bacterium]